MRVGSTRGEISETYADDCERDETVSYLSIGENRGLTVRETKHREKKTYQSGSANRTGPARQVGCRKDEITPEVFNDGRPLINLARDSTREGFAQRWAGYPGAVTSIWLRVAII